ncbi:MAG TPA: molybdenum cofactor biosynthesis protein MoaE [Actinomycetota bacterium]|nr:molybdenum cofactor biosynthesis protein MoaE [Actinomycetota bacterium]
MIVTGLSEQPLDVATLVAKIRSDDCGGLVVFEGTTRSPSDGRIILRLEYEAWEDRAETQLRALAEEAMQRFGARGVLAVHRTGVVPIGETSVVVACATPHRGEAFEATRWLIDTLKGTVAVWKKEVFEDGEAWTNADV